MGPESQGERGDGASTMYGKVLTGTAARPNAECAMFILDLTSFPCEARLRIV